MRKTTLFTLLALLLLACRAVTLLPQATPTPAPTRTSRPTSTATPQPTLSPTPLPTATAVSADPEGFSVEFHPDGPLYTGDMVSLSVIAPPGMDVRSSTVDINLDGTDGVRLASLNFGQWGIAGRWQATWLWGWDTQSLSPGQHLLSFTILPQEVQFYETVTFQPRSAMPTLEAQARWSDQKTDCCTIYYITHTASARDMSALSALVDEQARLAQAAMGAEFTQPVTVTILPRLLGHGGFATSEIMVSYLDRNYAANAWQLVVRHEMVHILDSHLGGDLRPSLFVEGLAVYLSGGHYKEEPLMPRCAALLPGQLDMYIPLADLADSFYASQHEIGYLEAASLIQYMVDTYGWESFSAFYRDIHPAADNRQSSAIQAALQAHFQLTLDALEQNFLAALADQPEAADWQEDVRLTVSYFDTMRRYQELLDPSAYFRTAWLMDSLQMRQRGITADYLRRPSQPANLALETMLIAASDQLEAGYYARADEILGIVNQVLDGVQQGAADAFSNQPLAANYLAITQAAAAAGYEVQSIELDGEAAYAQATAASLQLEELRFEQENRVWRVSR